MSWRLVAGVVRVTGRRVTFEPEAPTEQQSLPPRVLQGELFLQGQTLYMRAGKGPAGLISVLGILRRYRNRPIVLIIFDPAYTGGH